MKRATTEPAEGASAEIKEARRVVILKMIEGMKENLRPEPGPDAALARIDRMIGTLRLALETVRKDPEVPNADREVRWLERSIREFEGTKRELLRGL